MANACDKTGNHPALKTLTYQEYTAQSARTSLEILREHNLVVTECPTEQHSFDAKCLVGLTSLTKPVTIHGSLLCILNTS